MSDGDLDLRAIVVEEMVNKPDARAQGHELELESAQAARRDFVVETNPAAPIGQDGLEVGLAFAEGLHHRSLVLLLDIDG